jgi:hypothetical protein
MRLNDLQKEIRFMIWAFTLPNSRMVELCINYEYSPDPTIPNPFHMPRDWD